MPAPAHLLSRLAQRYQVSRDSGSPDQAFAAALGEPLDELDARIQLITEQEHGEHEKLRLGPDKDLLLLRQRVIFEMAAAGVDFCPRLARALVRALQFTGSPCLEALAALTGVTPRILPPPSSGRASTPRAMPCLPRESRPEMASRCSS